jgi:hypothetical protein
LTAGSPSAAQTRNYFAAVIILIGLYVLLDAVAQLLPPHYSPISQPESDLAVGPFGYVMAINFVDRGVLSILFVYALSRLGGANSSQRLGYLLVGVWGVASLVLSVSPTDVNPPPFTVHGVVHLIFATVGFFGGAVGEIALSRGLRSDPDFSRLKGVPLAIAVLAFVFFLLLYFTPAVSPLGAADFGGLLERIFLGLVLLWILVVSLFALRSKD